MTAGIWTVAGLLAAGIRGWRTVSKIELMVTVKGYPAISKKHGETVCVAGVRTDTERPQWVRLWPIPFRELEFSRRFSKYQVIALEAKKSRRDARPESYQPNTDSLALGPKIDTKNRWACRRKLIDPLRVDSMCELRRMQELNGTSLGIFRPGEVMDLEVGEANEWSSRQKAIATQPSLLFPGKTELEKLPVSFFYRYRCMTTRCQGHRMSVIDWELAQAYRSWRRDHGDERVFDAIRQKWLEEICGPSKDTQFFVGNMHLHPEQFLVLGVFWPPRG